MSHGRYTDHPIPNHSAGSNCLPSKRRSRYRLLRTSFPRWFLGAHQAQWIYRAGPGASISFSRVYVRRFALAARGSGELRKLKKNYKTTNITRRYSSTPPRIAILPACQIGGIRSNRFQTTAPVVITCLPNAKVGTGPPVRPPHAGFCGRNA